MKKYSNKSLTCEHNFPNEFDEIGDMTDNSFGFSSYLNFKSNNENEIFIGSYPYNSAKLWKCKKGGRLTFSYTDDSGWGRLTSLKIDFEKEYLTDPANKSVSIKPEKLNEFISQFGFNELHNPKMSDDYVGVKIISKIRMKSSIEHLNNFKSVASLNLSRSS